MKFLRTKLDLIILFCCGLLLSFMYFFHDNPTSWWTLPSTDNKNKQSVLSSPHDNRQINEYVSDSAQNVFSLNRKNTVFANKGNEETRTDIQADGKEEAENDRNVSFQLDRKPTISEDDRSKGYFSKNAPQTLLSKMSDQTGDYLTNVDNTMLKRKKTTESNDKAHGSIHADRSVLGDILEDKIKAVNLTRIKHYKPTCENDLKIANSCDNACLQTELPESPTTRVAQLVTPRNLQMSQAQHAILTEMASKVRGNYDIILITATSSNHFLESQALLKNLHENLYPYMKNFTLILYNLGLTDKERFLMVTYCKCQVLDFPFEKFHNFMTRLTCYSWKPVVIKAHIHQARVVFWVDASVRFHKSPSAFFKFIQMAQERGVLIGDSNADSVFRTNRSMYHFFGDEPCAYLGLGQGQATLGVYHREYFVDRVILEPWVACALNEDCMCARNMTLAGCHTSKIMAEKYHQGKGRIVYGLCHRFDQSAISLIFHKLYQDLFRWVMVDTNKVLHFKRRHTLVYFPTS